MDATPQITCPLCSGSGKRSNGTPCPECKGTSLVVDHFSLAMIGASKDTPEETAEAEGIPLSELLAERDAFRRWRTEYALAKARGYAGKYGDWKYLSADEQAAELSD